MSDTNQVRGPGAARSEKPSAHAPGRSHWLDIRTYGVTRNGVAYDLPFTSREPGRCPVAGCHCMDPA